MPKFVSDGQISRRTSTPSTRCSRPISRARNKPAPGGDPRLCRSGEAANTLPPQTEPTIGDLLSAKDVSWAWYAGAWQAALDGEQRARRCRISSSTTSRSTISPASRRAPPARAEHLRTAAWTASSSSRRSTPASCRRSRSTSRRATSTSTPAMPTSMAGDAHIADVIAHLEKSPQWAHMLVVVTYDENGGFWDHVAPPKGDRWGPGTRIPAIIVSPFAKKGYRRPHAVRHDLDPALHHAALRPAGAAGRRRARRGARGQRRAADGRPDRCVDVLASGVVIGGCRIRSAGPLRGRRGRSRP